jgi:hypothetical protein
MPDNVTGSGKGLSVPKNPALALRALNARHTVPSPVTETESETTSLTNNIENKTTKLQTDKPTSQQADRQSELQTDRQADKPPDKLPERIEQSGSDQSRAKMRPARSDRSAVPVAAAPLATESSRTPRVDGRTLRVRQETSDQTMVTSMRLAVATVEQLDEFCWRYRKRKQDVVQEALAFYFAAVAADEETRV